jgi:hypothetical protein
MNRDPLLHELDFDDYDAAADLRASIEFAYSYIRRRALHGGRGWHGWPNSAAVPDEGNER